MIQAREGFGIPVLDPLIIGNGDFMSIGRSRLYGHPGDPKSGDRTHFEQALAIARAVRKPSDLALFKKASEPRECTQVSIPPKAEIAG